MADAPPLPPPTQNSLNKKDLLTAGFPCQSWSVEGNMAGFADPRGALFFEISRILRHKQPAGFLLENVPNLVEVGGGGGTSSLNVCIII